MDEALKRIITGIDLTADQLPSVVEEVLLWHFYESLMWFVGRFIAFGLVIFFGRKYWDLKLDDEVPIGKIVTITAVLCMILSFLGSLAKGDGLDWLQIWLAPKSWLTDFAMNK